MTDRQDHWELTLIDAAPPVRAEYGFDNSAAADLDGDGQVELFVGGEGALLWYRPGTGEKGVIARGRFHVGMAIADVDGDGALELVTGVNEHTDGRPEGWMLCGYKPGASLSEAWTRFIIDGDCRGGAHDVLAVDLDGDGRLEVVANDCAGAGSGVYVYRRPEQPGGPWVRHAVVEGHFEEGLDAADLDGDGRIEIVSGPCWYRAPAAGFFAGPWERRVFAPDHREMNRVRVLDIAGRGRGDIVIVDSEYFEGRLSWFENRLVEAPDQPWIEHEIRHGLVYAHSLEVRHEGGEAVIFVAEMAAGGWAAPYNYDARLLELRSGDHGASWRTTVLDEGQGTHGAVPVDLDGDGTLAIFGKEHRIPRVQVWTKPAAPSPLRDYRHTFIDRDREGIATDIFAADVDGDGLEDIVCGHAWYRAPDWRRFDLPLGQALAAWDVDGDGRVEIIGTLPAPGAAPHTYASLSSRLVWLKSRDPAAGVWDVHAIGEGIGDWPHGTCIAPLLPGGRAALVTAYHSSHSRPEGASHYPQLWEVPDDPERPWPVRTLAEIRYGEELLARDITGNGTLDLFAGPWWLENRGDGTFTPHRFAADPDFYPARLAVADIAGNGRCDVVLAQEKMDYPARHVPFSTLAWFECPADPRRTPWEMHTIDRVRCAHSLGAADLDGDGRAEIICGEHDPFYPYRQRNRLFVYRAVRPRDGIWQRFQLDDRFEHHDGARLIRLADGRTGILSIGWQEPRYVHLWA